MKYYDGMGQDVSDYVAGLELAVAELKAKLELFTGKVETEDKPKPRRRTEPVADAE